MQYRLSCSPQNDLTPSSLGLSSLLAPIVFLLLIALTTLTQAAPPSNDLTLVWQDEFDGTDLDSTKWKTAPEWFRQGASYWSPDNYHLNGAGRLTLSVTESNGIVYAGAIRTHRLFDRTYGYFEVRCKLPQIKGGWAAFWMMPYGNHPGDAGRDGTEIDIFESINGWNNKVQHALHWDGYGVEHQKVSQSFTRSDLYDGGFHTFGVWWTENEYIFYIDNEETWRTSDGGVSQVKQYLKLTMEVSNADWPGKWSEQIEKPIPWMIDYVRVYEAQESGTVNIQKDPSQAPLYRLSISNNTVRVLFDNPRHLQDYKIEVWDLKGSLISKDSKIENADYLINLAAYTEGVYFVRVTHLKSNQITVTPFQHLAQ